MATALGQNPGRGHYNTGVPELAFFIGKGGVGKTTVSAAYAVRTALRNPKKRVLLLSTDPAHSLADVLEMRLKDKAKAVPLPGRGRLYAWQINAEELFRDFLKRHKEQILSIIDRGSIFTREEIEPLLDTTLPGMAEMSALLAINDGLRSGEYSHIVVDTAPFGHTLRLFGLPEAFLHFLAFLELATSRDRILAEHFGGSGGVGNADLLANLRGMVDGVLQAFMHAQLFLVTTPEKFALNESIRCHASLQAHSPPLEIAGVVLNRAVLGKQTCQICRKKSKSTAAARDLLDAEFPGRELFVGEDPGTPILGATNLSLFAAHVFSRKRLKLAVPAPKSREVRLRRVEWPVLEAPLSVVLGKGGVGKTTISAGLGFNTRSKRKVPVEICSVDPAPSLDDVFQQDIGDRPGAVLGDAKFRASEMDSVALFNRWVREIRESIDEATESEVSGIHVDLWFERQLLSGLLEIVPPGVDEVLAVFRILDLLRHQSAKVVIDMAPTGHALELLRMPERILAWTRPLLKTLAGHRTLAIARDAGVKIAEVGQQARELAGLLRNSERANVCVVMLAEPLPDQETGRLMSDLCSLNVPAKFMFINRVLFQKDAGNCRRCRRAIEWQQATLARLKMRYQEISLYLVRNFPNEIAGKQALRSFTGELWQLG